jgi:hypothetical protein
MTLDALVDNFGFVISKNAYFDCNFQVRVALFGNNILHMIYLYQKKRNKT